VPPNRQIHMPFNWPLAKAELSSTHVLACSSPATGPGQSSLQSTRISGKAHVLPGIACHVWHTTCYMLLCSSLFAAAFGGIAAYRTPVDSVKAWPAISLCIEPSIITNAVKSTSAYKA
jgi:hypothetical protein